MEVGVATVLGLVLCWLVARKVFFILLVRYARKLLEEMPLARWMTLDEVVALGCPKVFARIILPLFSGNKLVEIRLAENFPVWIQGIAAANNGELQVHPFIAQHFEYCLTRRRYDGQPRRIRIARVEPNTIGVPVFA